MRPKSQMVWRPDPDFQRVSIGRRDLIVHREIEAHAAALLQKLNELAAGEKSGAGNRGSAFHVALPGAPEMIARRCRRGGLAQYFVTDTFLGLNPRPLQELAVTLEAARRGIPVASPLGAMIEWIGPVFYRGFFLTRAAPGLTLWEFMRTDDDPTVREHVLLRARAAIDTMHEHGLFHADLNLHNLLVTKARESFAVMILDLDKARLSDGPLSAEMRRANYERLMRSARKLDPSAAILDDAALSVLIP